MSIALCIPYELKDRINLDECQWNKYTKLWYYIDTSLDCTDRDCETVNKYELVYLLNTKYNDKEYIKKYGGCWDNDKKLWYTYISNDILTKKFKFETKGDQDQRENLNCH
jgi:hypothetical protein